MNAIAPVSTRSGMPALMPSNMTEAMNLATMMSQGKLVPAALQKSPADCLMVIEQAMRWGMSPFAVAQEVSVIQGKLMFSGKIVSAAVHTAPGVLEGRLNYAYSGDGAGLAVTVSGVLRGESSARTVNVTLASAKTGNQWWSKTPEQMLAYHGARVWARRHAPEVMLGVYSPEEFDGPTIEATPEPVSRPAPPRSTAPTINANAEQIPADFDAPPPPKRPSAAEWIGGIIKRLQAMQSIEDYNDLLGDEKFADDIKAFEPAFPKLFSRYDAERAATLDRLVSDADPTVRDDGE